MIGKNFANRFFGRGMFELGGFGERNLHNCEKLTPEEKADILDMRMEAFKNNEFPFGFFKQKLQKFQEFGEQWAKMSKEEKIEHMKKREKEFKEKCSDENLISRMDEKCEEWMNMSAEEKKSFIKERKSGMPHGGYFGRERDDFEFSF